MRPKPDFLPRMRGATGSVAGRRGLVPKPAATDNNKALFGDGAWRAVSGTGTAATKAEADAGTDTTKYVAPDALAYALAAKRNALAPRGGLAFDGTAGTRVYSTLTNQNIGTDAYALHFVFKKVAGVTHRLGYLASSATEGVQARALQVSVSDFTANKLSVLVRGAAGSDYRYVESPDLSGFDGKVVHATITHNGASAPLIYINGVLQTTTAGSGVTPPAWGETITSTYFGVGYLNSSGVNTGTIYSASLYNLALTQADITEIVELGGAVPERFKFGNQAALYTSNFSAGVDGWTEYAGNQTIPTGNVDGISGVDDCLRISRNTSGYVQYSSPPTGTPAQGKAYRLTFDYYADVASGISALAYTTGFGANINVPVVEGSWQTGKVLDWLGIGSAVHYFTANGGSLAVGKNLYLKNAVAKRIGAVCHYDADLDGIGYQLHDQSTNKLHALLTTTGVSWSKAATMGYIKVLSDGTTSAQALGGGTILPANCQIIRVRARSISGTPSITLGTASGGSQIVASVALSTTWKDLTIALTGGINSSANSLWMTASAANVVEVQLAYEQLPA